jgi:hypothetical protein
MKQNEYEKYRQAKTEDGLRYQDFVVDLLCREMGFAVIQYVSRPYQYAVGESRTGVEIKLDEKYVTTRNLWIEVGEKARPRPGDYSPSGIDRPDNTWLYVIGDYSTVYAFPTRLLRAVRPRYQVIPNNRRTSIGFLLPEAHARKYAAFILSPGADGNDRSEPAESGAADVYFVGTDAGESNI